MRLILSPFGTLALDQNTFIAWSTRLSQVGFSKFYLGNWSDYLPGYLYILNLLAQIAKTNIIPNVVLYKLPAIISDIGTGYLIYRIVRKLKNEKWGLITASLYVFNPAVIANSALWGQVDSLTALFSLLTLWSLEFNPYVSAFSLAIGTLIKPQMAVISLIILVLMIQKKWKLTKIFSYIMGSFLIFIGGFIPFNNTNNLVSFIISRLNTSLNQYPYTSVNAFNFWAIGGTWKPDAGFNIIGGLVILVLFFTFGMRFLKQKGGEYILMAFTFAISYLFMTRMHERHLLPVFAPLTIAVAFNPVFIFSLVGFSFVYVLNLYWAWAWVTNHFDQVFSDLIVKTLSVINILMLAVFLLPEKFSNLFSFLERTKKDTRREVFSKAILFEKINISSQTIKIMFIGVVFFAALTRLYDLPSPRNNYFDEVYHAFTAQNMLHGVTRAWEWWNPNPEGFAYEWTHPPLAKEGMVLGMKFLGENSFGYRFPGAILGVGSVILIFFILKRFLKMNFWHLLHRRHLH